jgi:glycosyltransferase involved in cell wall biosynthesis
LVAAEAMACGCTLVATRTGFAAGLKDQVEACLVEPTATSLANGLRELIADPERRKQIALAGQRRVQTLRWPDNVQRLHDFYLYHLQHHLKTYKASQNQAVSAGDV